jgi:hypothetical protein
MLKKNKTTRDFSFNISGPVNPSRSSSVSSNVKPKKKKEASGDVETVRIKKTKLAEKPQRARDTDEPDDNDFGDDRPRPPKPKHAKRRMAERPAKAPKPKNALVLQAPKSANRISRLSSKGLNSILGEDAEALQQLLESGDSDSALSQLNKRLIQTSIDLISEVEAGIRESKGRYGVHSFNGLVQSIRELMIDLQSTQDRGAIGLSLVENILRPNLLDIGMSIMKEYSVLADDVKSLGLADDRMIEFRQRQVESRTRIGNAIQGKYEEMKQGIISGLQR